MIEMREEDKYEIDEKNVTFSQQTPSFNNLTNDF